MKKMKAVLISICMMIVLTACGGEKVDEATSTKYIQKAEEIVTFLNEGKYTDLIDMFDDKMKAALTEEKLKEIEPVIQQSGDYEKIEKSSVEKKDSSHIVVLAGKYTKQSRIYTISFNENDEVSGLFVK